MKREGIDLPTSFTSTINAELSLGQLQESVTVTGESPLVDVRGSVSQSVMNRERLDTIPTGKDPFGVGQLIAGVTTSTPDVGGTQVMQQPTLQVHGSSNNDNVFIAGLRRICGESSQAASCVSRSQAGGWERLRTISDGRMEKNRT